MCVCVCVCVCVCFLAIRVFMIFLATFKYSLTNYNYSHRVCVCVCVLVTQWYLILCDPMNCSPPGSSVHGILQARILEWVAMTFSRGSSRPRDQTWVSSIAGRFFTIWTTSHIPVLTYFVTGSLYLLTPLTQFAHPLHPACGNHHSVSINLGLCCYCFRFHIQMRSHDISSPVFHLV